MYCSTTITIKSHHFVYTFVALLAAKCCCDRQVNKRRQQPMLLHLVLPLLMFSEKFLMSDVLATNLMLTGLLCLFFTFPLLLG